ncbi:MAG: hypothetical protein PVI23_13725 [Maricaulaceae bacterium]
MHRRLAIAALLGAAFLAAACSTGGRRPNLTPPPANLPAAALAPGSALLGGDDFSARDPNLDWGVGVLRPAGGGDAVSAIDLPLFDRPGGRHWGWVTQGRIYDLASRRALSQRSDAMVTVSDGPAFLVLARDGDWMQIRYGYDSDTGGGLAWTRPDWASGRRAQYLEWSSVLRGGAGLVYRNAQVAHNLRAGPGTDSAVLEVLEGGNFDMRALELRGDWMRVEVTSPPACIGSIARDLLLGGQETSVRTGWIAWRSDARGPWVVSAATERCGAGA